MNSAAAPALQPLATPPAKACALIVALDFPSAGKALRLVERLEGRCAWVKVGLQLYLAAGPAIVERLRRLGLQVFLDLKLHDIPNTVAGAVTSLASSGASLLTVHALGGPRMLEAAQQAARLFPDGPQLLAVTILTSMDLLQMQSIGLEGSPADAVSRLARMARQAGVPGMVCSPEELRQLRGEVGDDPLLVVPGIRPTSASLDDQSRVATPAAALADGASMLVIGRPITAAKDPAAALDAILAELGQRA